MSQLPDKPSDLIELALSDLEKCEKDPEYKIEMGDWHAPYAGTCEVCLAGGVMAQTLDAPIDEDVSPCDFEDIKTCDKLEALDSFRTGEIETGLNAMGCDRPNSIPATVKNTYYRTDPVKFKADMRSIAAKLREVGL